MKVKSVVDSNLMYQYFMRYSSWLQSQGMHYFSLDRITTGRKIGFEPYHLPDDALLITEPIMTPNPKGNNL